MQIYYTCVHAIKPTHTFNYTQRHDMNFALAHCAAMVLLSASIFAMMDGQYGVPCYFRRKLDYSKYKIYKYNEKKGVMIVGTNIPVPRVIY